MIYNFVKFYILSLYHIVFSKTLVSMIYFPALIVLVSLFYNRFRFHNLKSRIKELAKPLLSASLQSFAIAMLVGVMVGRALQGADWFSIPVLADQLHCILIIIFSQIYSRLKLNRERSIVYGILLVIFSVRIVGEAIFGIGMYVIPDNIFPLHMVLAGILILTIIQAILLIRTIRNYNKIIFFIALFFANIAAVFITKYTLHLFI